MLLPTFRGRVDGKGTFRPDKPDRLKTYLLSLANRKVVLTVGEEKNLRSQNQNRYMWGVVYKLIADDTGHTPEEIHEYLASKFLSERSVVDRRRKIVKSTTSLTTMQFEDYLEQCRVWAVQELGVVVPMPNEVDVFE